MDSTTFAGGGDISSFASPLEQVFRNVPKAHEKPLRQAVYNVLAILVFGLISYGTYYVIFVLLWPFFLPIMWALMSGLVIHPHKTSFADALRQALADMAASEKTTVVAIFSGCLSLIDGACDLIGGYVFAKWKMLTAISVIFAIAQLTLTMDSVSIPTLLGGACSVLDFISSVSARLVGTRNALFGSALAYIISVGLMWNPNRNLMFKIFSYILWFWFFFYCLNFVSFLYCLGSFVILKLIFRAPATEEDGDQVDSDGEKGTEQKRNRFRETAFAILRRLQGAPAQERPNNSPAVERPVAEQQPEESEAADATKNKEEVDATKDSEVPTSANVTRASDKPNVNLLDVPPMMATHKIEHPGVSAIRRFHMSSRPGHNTTSASEMFNSPMHKINYSSTPASTKHLRKHYRTVLSRGSAGSCAEGPDGQAIFVKESDLYINLVSGCFLVLQLWNHPILLHLLPIPIGYSLIKRAFVHFGSSDYISALAKKAKNSFWSWLSSRVDILVPRPARMVWIELGRLKRAVLQALPKYSDTIVTTVLILACIVSSVVLLVIVSLQIYAESLYLVQMGGRIFATVANSSLYQQLNTLGDDGVSNNTYAKGLEDAIESAYHYGRDYISSTVVSMLGETRDRTAVQEFETKLLELWDRIYQYWLTSRAIQPSSTHFGPQVSQEAIASSAEEVFQRLINIDDFNLSSVSQFAVNNMGVLTSVLEQGWILLMSNASFALGVATEIIRILFLSGYGMVNFGFGMAVYFSALFYLLRVEGQVYKPVEVISSYGHLVGDGFASALNKAVNSVFTLTAKMAYFYGMWTYITHTMFRASVVTVPVLVAAFLAAVPIAGQYLVALPAALELWLAEDRWGSALALIICHLVPPYVVDAAIYSEVRHGIHPWITGLSIVGGVYCFGIPGGAIYGPVILCIVYVVWTMTMYTGFLSQFGFEPAQNEINLGKSKLLLGTPLLKRSESIF